VTLVMDSSESYWRLHAWPCDPIGRLVSPGSEDMIGGSTSKVSVRRSTGGNRMNGSYIPGRVVF
jgi:hypothetical protein